MGFTFNCPRERSGPREEVKKPEPNVDLHDLHRRRLGATVQLLEQSLARMEDLLRHSERKAILSRVENTLSREDREGILDKIRELRAALEDLAERFMLPGQSLDVRQILGAELATAWVMLENCRPKRMKGYGVEFGEKERKALEESVEELLAKVVALREMFR